MTPAERYQQAISQNNFIADPEQAAAIEHLQNLYLRLLAQSQNKSRLWQQLKQKIRKAEPVKGLYLWGGVGRGKTWMMDIFYDSLPFADKIRLHFHQFMQTVHDQLELIKGQKNPLTLVARNFAKSYRVICLDEFHVSDITDAMLLHGLLEALFKEGICLVCTSNLKPDDLYKNGLQRQRFLPAIERLKQYCEIVHIGGQTDHRLRLLEKAQTWYCPADDRAQAQLKQRFTELSTSQVQYQQNLHLNYRQIPCIALSDGLVWFDFEIICSAPRGSADYIEIACCYHTVFISQIPRLDESKDDLARRFVNMIDEFYDHNIKLIVSCDVMPDQLYTGRQLRFEFQRTASRLEEMRSHEYLARPHRG